MTNTYLVHPLLCQDSQTRSACESLKAPQMTQQVLLKPPDMMELTVSEDTKRNVLLVGLTGVGKSETGNRMCRFQFFQNQPFSTSSSLVSVTSKVDYEDVPVGKWPGGWKAWSPHTWVNEKLPKHQYRIIDAPGFFDTSLSHEQVSQCLDTFGTVAREGLAAIIVVVKDGHHTRESGGVQIH